MSDHEADDWGHRLRHGASLVHGVLLRSATPAEEENYGDQGQEERGLVQVGTCGFSEGERKSSI